MNTPTPRPSAPPARTLRRSLLLALGAVALLLPLGPAKASPSAQDTPAPAASAPDSATPERALLASVSWPPFSAAVGQERIAIDIVHEALSRGGIQAETLIVDDGKVNEAILKGAYDGSPAIWRSDDREAYLLFSEPYLENRLVLVGRKGANVDAASLSDLEGVRVGIVESYAYGSEVTDAEGPVFVPGQNDQQNLDRLLAGEIDIMLCDELIVRYTLQRQGSEAAQYLAYGDTALIRRPLHLAVRKDLPGAANLIGRFNDAIQTMIADGTFNRILRIGWIQADADGDGVPELIPHTQGTGALPGQPTYTYTVTGTDASKTTERYWIDGEIVEGAENLPGDPDVQPAPWPEPGVTEFVVFRLRF